MKLKKYIKPLKLDGKIVEALKKQIRIKDKSAQEYREIGRALDELKTKGYKVSFLLESFGISQPEFFKYSVFGRAPDFLFAAYSESKIKYTALISFCAIHRYAPETLPALLDSHVRNEISLIEIQDHALWLRSVWIKSKQKKEGYRVRGGGLSV